MVRSSIRAVEALMTSSYLLDCTTGRSAGFAPFKDAADQGAGLTICDFVDAGGLMSYGVSQRDAP
jgi:hypothetical protein